MGFLGLVAVSFPLVGVLFAIIWSILFDFEASVRTACHVSCFFPQGETDPTHVVS